MPQRNPKQKKKKPTQTKVKPKLKRTLKRKPSYRPLVADDRRWLWAAYVKGSFPEKTFPAGLEIEEFDKVVDKQVETLDEAYILEIDERPVGLVGVFFNPRYGYIEPHVIWFEWATSRNKVETAVKFIDKMRKKIPIMLIVDEDVKNFFTHIERHGIIKRIGTSQEAMGQKKLLFESRGKL